MTGVAAFAAGWTALGSGNANARAATLTAPGKPATSSAPTASQVALTWTAATGVTPASAIGYQVERAPFNTTTWTNVCGSSAASPIAATSCNDNSVAANGHYQYRLTSIVGSWKQVSLTSDEIITPAAAASPNVPGTPDLTNASDSNINNDNITNVTTPTFTGNIVGQTGQTVHIFVDGVDKGSGSGTGSSYSVTTSVLADGGHTITAKATVDGTTFSTNNGSLNVTIDTQLPPTPSMSPSSTQNNRVILTFSDTEAGVSFECQ